MSNHGTLITVRHQKTNWPNAKPKNIEFNRSFNFSFKALGVEAEVSKVNASMCNIIKVGGIRI